MCITVRACHCCCCCACPTCCPDLVQVYNNLHELSTHRPVAHNKEGSFLTMWSQEGLVFGIINVIGNFGTVFVDQVRTLSVGP